MSKVFFFIVLSFPFPDKIKLKYILFEFYYLDLECFLLLNKVFTKFAITHCKCA